jgi:hypothetical protein
MPLPHIILPLSIILRLIDILILPHPMFLIIQPFSIIEAVIEIGSLTGTLTAAVYLFPNINGAIGKDYC